MESCSDSMYFFSPKMTTACTPKSAFLWDATQFPDITLPGDCVDEEMASRVTFLWFLLMALNDLCVFCQNQDLGEDEPSNTQTSGSESWLVTRGTGRPHRLFQEGQTRLNSVVVCCRPPGFLCFGPSR